ncbi:hypothetical protein NIES4075_52960 [Tolypothrix sp. NIES-4075]|uniref:hypothetical protein n=1 Tax=Tolypothrix sp. NIES-4075 TaxID=2005459 RepID=UPI000B5C7AA0|nr:hypothetical protein [Tolypothrix sp. NIES-4075]GAX44278.1 hypothetical protein NIES4075_52960 [Tolypothrix sp. NIES-4075]
MSEPELPSEKGKASEKQINVDGLLFVFVLVPAVLFVFSMVITDYLAQTPPDRSKDDAARNSFFSSLPIKEAKRGQRSLLVVRNETIAIAQSLPSQVG